MQEIICYSDSLPEGTEKIIPFLLLLLDESLAKGELLYPENICSEIGGINTRLTAKQNYEFLLRAVRKYTFRIIGRTNISPDIPVKDNCSKWDVFRTDCYIAGKYCQELQDSGYLSLVIEQLLSLASDLSDSKTAVEWLEKMISHAPEYYAIDDDTRPFLIYKGSSICYNILNVFSEELAKALIQCHQRVIIFDPQQENLNALSRYIHQRFKAVIGVQSSFFHLTTDTANDVSVFHDLILGPKFNIILDHPAYLRELTSSAPRNYYLLIHDRNYMNYVTKYCKEIAGVFHFAPAGLLPESSEKITKLYDISFIGYYIDYRNYFHTIESYDRKTRSLALHYLKELKHHPERPAEEILSEILNHHISFSNADPCFPDIFYNLRDVNYCIMNYYREKVICALLSADLEIHVYGKSWKSAPFANHPCLIHHPEIDARENIVVMQQSKISLNVMKGHKDGFTERIANALLCHSVVLSDKSTTLENNFQNGKELVLFDLKEIHMLPAIVNRLLNDSEQIAQIAQNGYVKACKEHLWIHRAKQLLHILSTDIADSYS